MTRPEHVFDVDNDVLMNVGTKVFLHRTRPLPETSPNPAEMEYETADGWESVPVRFTNMKLALIEDTFGGLTAWQIELANKPYGAVIKTLAVVTKRTYEDLAAAVDGTRLEEYQYALIVAYGISTGMKVDRLGKIKAAGRALIDQKDNLELAMLETWTQGMESLVQTASHMVNGSQLGSPSSDEAQPSSGKQVQPSSSSTSGHGTNTTNGSTAPETATVHRVGQRKARLKK